MKKSIFTIAFSLIITLSASAQDIGTVFLSMPESIVVGLETSQKDKLISNPNDTAMVAERGTFGEIKRLGISPDFISLQTSDAGTTQIKLLSLINDSKIICVVKTVCGKICDSQIQFYTTKWIPIAQGDLFPRKNKDWFIKTGIDKDSQEFKNAYAALDMNPMKISFSGVDTSLKVDYDIKNYLSEGDYKNIEPYLIENPKVFKWDKTSYK